MKAIKKIWEAISAPFIALKVWLEASKEEVWEDENR